MVGLGLLTVMVVIGLAIAPALTLAPASSSGGVGSASGAAALHADGTLPTSVATSLATPTTDVSVPFPLQVTTTITNGDTNNSTTSMWLTVENTNSSELTSVLSFNGTVPGPVANVTDQLTGYTYQTFTWGLTNVSGFTVNQGAYTCGADPWCGTLYAPGNVLNITVYVVENGASFGGTTVTSVTSFSITVLPHTTSIAISEAALPLFVPTPYDAVVTTTIAQGNITNATTSAWFTLVDTLSGSTLQTWSLNNTVVAADVTTSNDTANGTGYWAYTWNVTVGGFAIPYQVSALTFYIEEDGTTEGGTAAADSSAVSAVFATNVTTASIYYTSAPPSIYSSIPFSLSLNISLGKTATSDPGFTVPVSTATTSLAVNVVDITAGAACGWFSVPVVNGQSSYSFGVNQTTLSGSLNNTACNLAADTIGFTAYVNVTGTFAPLDSTNSTAASTVSTNLLLTGVPGEATNATLLSPGSTTLGLGNVTFVVSATGQFISSVKLQVLLGTTIVLNSVLLAAPAWPGQYQPVTWSPAAAGAYTTSIQVVNAYGAPTYVNSSLTIVNTGVTKTTTTYYNQTAFGGLSPQVAGTILLVVGLIIGMIVALLVAASVQRSKAPQAAPQAWSGDSKTTTPGANTCSVCGQSFPSAEELQAHAKAEHGMN
ncbi:MAG: hypothetical protein WA719_02435 [Thermoplasmata archaeon]